MAQVPLQTDLTHHADAQYYAETAEDLNDPRCRAWQSERVTSDDAVA